MGGKLEVKMKIRDPFSSKQVEETKEKWLVIDHWDRALPKVCQATGTEPYPRYVGPLGQSSGQTMWDHWDRALPKACGTTRTEFWPNCVGSLSLRNWSLGSQKGDQSLRGITFNGRNKVMQQCGCPIKNDKDHAVSVLQPFEARCSMRQ